MPGVVLPPNKAGDRMGPAWIPELLGGSYFVPCHHHAAAHKSERNFFCADCGGESLCHLCVQKHHAGHTTMQIRRSSYHEVVRISDVQRLLDIAHIQVYVINSAKIVFLNGRPQAKPVKGALYACETCHRTLLDACRFCSIGCKLAAVSEDFSLNLQPRVQSGGSAMGLADAMEDSGESGPRRVSNHRNKRTVPPLLIDVQENSDDDSLGDSDAHDSVSRRKRRRTKAKGRLDFPPLEATSSPENSLMLPSTPPQFAAVESPWKMHRRKSVPHRAPMW